ncbi:MAG TPA: amidase family protein [Jatrophihabitans sp.]|jgi:amidase|uniref:amidase n=1 Tax=Jatrophihabitans sp. TaxID=1932789 RepID=UPI002DF8B795|nr:amidase family protein [Jatrophihabitans sp.]
MTAVEIAADVRSGRGTARQAVEHALERIENIDPDIGAYQEVRVFAALREADAVDARPDRESLPLAGVPVAIKDNVAVAGEPMRVGSASTDPTGQPADHEIVRRLRAAGAVVVGLTRVPELCVFGATDSTFGTTHNPWDRARTPGGSSGGSAAAVASGTVPIALGNDGMGSIRIPAACCGLVGLKPGSGVVPADLGNGSWFGMAENGPLATTVADAALMFSVLAARPDYADIADPGPLRIAVSIKVPAAGTPLDQQWAAAARRAGDLLRGAGHAVEAADPPYDQRMFVSEAVRWTAGTELDAQLVSNRSALDARVRRHAALGRLALRAGLPKENGRRRWQQRAGSFFADHDVLVTPALAQPPIAARRWSHRGWLSNVWANARYAPFAAPWNLAGWPAMTVPAGLDRSGLPLAVQLVARPGGEATLLAVAAQLERLHPWPRTAPNRKGTTP